MSIKELFNNFKRSFCNYQEYEDERKKQSDEFNSLMNKLAYERGLSSKQEEIIIKLKEERDIYYKKSEECIEDLNNAELTPVDAYCKRKGYKINNFVYKDKIIIGDIKIPCNLREMITPNSYVVEKVRKSIAKTDIKFLWYQRVMNKVAELIEWTLDGRYDNYYYPAYTLTTGKGDCDDFGFSQCSIEPELATAFGFYIENENKVGHAFAVGVVNNELWVFDAVPNKSIIAEGKNYSINYIITKNNIYVVDGSTDFGDILWSE